MTLRAFLLTLMCFAPVVGAATARTAVGDDRATVEEGWISLFNGADLAGWEGLPGKWTVVDGAIQGSQPKEESRNTNLILSSSRANPERFADFELRFRYRWITPTGNSGMQFRGVIDAPQVFHVGGYQADIDASNRWTGMIYDEANVAGKRGAISKRRFRTKWSADGERCEKPFEMTDAALRAAIRPVGQWNDVTILAKGPHIAYAINGTRMTELSDDGAGSRRDGVIGLQLHGGHDMTVQFKDIAIRSLAAEEPAPPP